jgi:hypothetical protein
MRLVVHSPKPSDRHVRIELSGGQGGVAQELLDDPQISTALEQMRRRAVPQAMWADVRCSVDCRDRLMHHGAGLALIEPPAPDPD